MADPAVLAAPAAAAVLVIVGAAIQVAVGAGLSVVCGPFMLLWMGTGEGVPVLLCLNLLVSVVAAAFGGWRLRWRDVGGVSAALLAGCAVAVLLPSLPDPVLRGITALVLALAALPRPAAPGQAQPARPARAGLVLAGLMTGALTVWTATPGPVIPVAMARAGWPGGDIRRAMQPIAVVGYGAALVLGGPPRFGAPGVFAGPVMAALVAATLAGTGAGFLLRRRIHSGRVVSLTRVVAATSAVLLVLSLFR